MKKLLSAAFVLLAVGAAPLMAAPTITDLTKGLDTFTTDVPKSLPFAAGSGIDWSTAYIGNLINADFPFVHLGLGATVGATTIPGDAIKPLVTSLGQSFSGAYLPLPFVTINGRIGGLVVPFDVGFKVGFIPDAFSTIDGYKINYNTFGVDVRYSVIKSNLVFPDVIFGVGVSGMTAGFSKSYGSQVQYNDGNTLTVSAPKLTVDLTSMEYEAKAQISKGFVILTPYLGLGVGYGTGDAKAGIKSNVTASGGDFAHWQNTYGLNVTSAGFSKSKNAGGFNSRVYGGTSFDILALKLDLQGEYSILDGAFGGSVGARIQL